MRSLFLPPPPLPLQPLPPLQLPFFHLLNRIPHLLLPSTFRPPINLTPILIPRIQPNLPNNLNPLPILPTIHPIHLNLPITINSNARPSNNISPITSPIFAENPRHTS